ncbi:MAG: UDP-2,3-diacylglucosamine diphosphatase [Candidatus Symbiodolus clandestinus]
MTTLFIADLHLQPDDEEKLQLFLEFLEQQASQAEALYILGDLFEVWIGDDAQQPLHQAVREALQRLAKRRIPCYFMAGNRDFLLGRRFATDCQLTLLTEPQLLMLYQVPTLILHGDSLCTDDIAYQRLRYWVRHPKIQQLFLSLPLAWRCWLAKRLRSRSQYANQKKTSEIMDVNPQAVVALLQQYSARRMIHGHTHRLARHIIPLVHSPLATIAVEAERWVLGAWEPTASVLQVDAQGAKFLGGVSV